MSQVENLTWAQCQKHLSDGGEVEDNTGCRIRLAPHTSLRIVEVRDGSGDGGFHSMDPNILHSLRDDGALTSSLRFRLIAWGSDEDTTNRPQTMYHGEWVDVCVPHDRFIALATKLRELGATQVTDGTMSVTFAPQPKLVATLPLTAPVERTHEREGRDGKPPTPVHDLSTREGRDAARAETLKQLGMVK